MRIILFILVFLSLQSHAQNTLEQQIKETMEKYTAVGLSVAVVKNNKIIYRNAFGLKDIATNTPLQSSDIFRIASISKSFTATAIMQLAEQKRLSIDDDISKYIGFEIRNPKYPDKIITLKMMLSHTSSINDSQGYFQLKTINPAENKEWKKCYNSYSPGTEYEYSNLNFNILGTVVERVSGERFDQYVSNHILKPLDLYGGYWIDALDKSKLTPLYNFDTGENKFIESKDAYHPRRNEIENYSFGMSTPIFSPTGGMKISAPDLAKYMIMHMNHGKSGKTKIINKKSSKMMQTPVNEKSGYGLALRKTDTVIPNKTLTGHTGSAYGLYSIMFFDPKKKFGIVAITNGCKDCPGDEYNRLLPDISRILYNELNLSK